MVVVEEEEHCMHKRNRTRRDKQEQRGTDEQTGREGGGRERPMEVVRDSISESVFLLGHFGDGTNDKRKDDSAHQRV